MIVVTEVIAINQPTEPPAFIGAEPKHRRFPFHFAARRFVSATQIPAAASPSNKPCTVIHIEGQGDVFSDEPAEAIAQKVRRALGKGSE